MEVVGLIRKTRIYKGRILVVLTAFQSFCSSSQGFCLYLSLPSSSTDNKMTLQINNFDITEQKAYESIQYFDKSTSYFKITIWKKLDLPFLDSPSNHTFRFLD